MKTNLKDGIWIEGFDDNPYVQEQILRSGCHDILYSGKTSDIPEELMRYVCELQSMFDDPEYINKDIDRYKNYQVEYTWYDCTAKQSIQSACSDKYCIIYKKG